MKRSLVVLVLILCAAGVATAQIAVLAGKGFAVQLPGDFTTVEYDTPVPEGATVQGNMQTTIYTCMGTGWMYQVTVMTMPEGTNAEMTDQEVMDLSMANFTTMYDCSTVEVDGYPGFIYEMITSGTYGSRAMMVFRGDMFYTLNAMTDFELDEFVGVFFDSFEVTDFQM